MAILDQIGLDLGQGNTDYYLADAQARANEATDYDPTATYAVNDLCLYEGVLKQCTTAIPVAEAWDATHWRTVTIGGQIVALRSRFTAPTAQAAGADGLVPGAAANTTGLYLKEDGTWGKPTGSDLETSSSDNTSIATTLGNLNDQIVALQTGKQDVLISINETISTDVGSGSVICKRYGNTVTLSIATSNSNTGSVVLATLSSNYRPSSDISAVLSNNSKTKACSIRTNGQITGYSIEATDIYALITYVI